MGFEQVEPGGQGEEKDSDGQGRRARSDPFDLSLTEAGERAVEEAERRERVETLEAALAEAEARASASERGRELDRLLIETGAVDLETARTMAQALIGDLSSEDLGTAVAELRARKPFLFRPSGGPGVGPGGGSASGALPEGFGPRPGARSVSGSGLGAAALAAEARKTGDRGRLYDYLRARRNG